MLDLLDKINNIYYIIMDKPKDKKKIKGGKSKKKMKQPKISSDKKTIEALKKQLRLITEKYLNDRKTRTKDPEKFKKDSDRIKKKVNNAKSPDNIAKLISMLSGNKPPETIAPSQPAPSIPSTRGTMSERINTENLSKKYDRLLNKWNNLDYSDEKKVREFYRDFKGFGEDMADFGFDRYKYYKKGYDEIKLLVGGLDSLVRKMYSTMSGSRPEGTDPPNNPAPPPPPEPAPPPPAQEPPAPQAQPPDPPPPPPSTPLPPTRTTSEYLQDGLSSMVQPALGIGLLYGGGVALRNINRLRNNNAQLARQQDRLDNIVAPIATGLAERAVGEAVGGLFPPTQGEPMTDSLTPRRNRDRSGLDSRNDLAESIKDTTDDIERSLSERTQRRLEREAQRNLELKRVSSEIRKRPDLRGRDKETSLKKEFGEVQQDAEAVETVRPKIIRKSPNKVWYSTNYLLQNPQIDRTELGVSGQEADIAEAQNLEDRLPQIPQGQTDPPMPIGDLET